MVEMEEGATVISDQSRIPRINIAASKINDRINDLEQATICTRHTYPLQYQDSSDRHCSGADPLHYTNFCHWKGNKSEVVATAGRFHDHLQPADIEAVKQYIVDKLFLLCYDGVHENQIPNPVGT